MKRLVIMILACSLSVIFSASAFADHHAVKITEKAGVGKYLTDAKGMTLYWFVKDNPGASSCSGECLEKWPLYYRETVIDPTGKLTADFSTIERADGQKQTAFRGYPLYYFFKDKMVGDTNGQGAKQIWYVIDPDNFPVK